MCVCVNSCTCVCSWMPKEDIRYLGVSITTLFLWDMISPQNISWPGGQQTLVILYPYSTGNLGMNRDPWFFFFSWGPGGLNVVLKHYYSPSHCLDLEINTLRINLYTSTVIYFQFPLMPLMKKMLNEELLIYRYGYQMKLLIILYTETRFLFKNWARLRISGAFYSWWWL